jgi:hypothetical protein
MSEFKTWEELSRKEQLAATHYDFYKDVHGIRPRWMNYDAMTEAELEAELDQLSKESDVQAAREKEEQERASHDFEMRVLSLMMSGAKTRDQALRWIHEAEGSNGDDEFLCYLTGLPYGYFRKAA